MSDDSTDPSDFPRYVSGYGARRRCTICNIIFQRATPHSKPAGYTRCRACEHEIVRKRYNRKSQALCDRCGQEFTVPRSRLAKRRSQLRLGKLLTLILCGPCGEDYQEWRKIRPRSGGRFIRVTGGFTTPRDQE